MKKYFVLYYKDRKTGLKKIEYKFKQVRLFLNENKPLMKDIPLHEGDH